MANTSKNISMVFDTISVMLNDKNIKLGMVVQTLGKNKINDNYGAMYKIMENPNDEIGKNDYILKSKPKLKAVRIESSTFEERLRTCENFISDYNEKVSGEITGELEEMKAEISNLSTQVKNTDIVMIIETLTVGIKLALLGNGQKAVVVTDIDADAEDDTHMEVSITEDGIVTATLALNDDVLWATPSTLELLNYRPATLFVNDNCGIEFKRGSESVPNSLVFTINRQLTPAVYYYI